MYPYDNLYNFLSKYYTDSSDNDANAGAAVITIKSESENKIEINLYQTKIPANEVQGLGKPVKILLSDTDSMLDLVDISESEESIVFVLTQPNSSCTTSTEDDDEERDMTLFSDEEMMDLASDEGEKGLTSFDAAMLVNVKGNVEGVQMELYDSSTS